MAYFNEIPNLEVISRFLNADNNEEYIKIKNLWRRAKLRDDIANAVTAFNYYQIKDNERPDQIAQKYYGDPELDWVVLITNNIININEDWPLDNNSLYNYLIEKYGSEEALQEIHHIETIEEKDSFNRLVIPKELVVDQEEFIPESITTSNIETPLQSFPAKEDQTEVTVNLVQALNVNQIIDGDVLYPITSIQEETSSLEVYTRSSSVIDIPFNNNLENNWPSGWGGELIVYGRDQNTEIIIENKLNSELNIDNRINITEKLYEISSTIQNDQVIPTFKFRYLPS